MKKIALFLFVFCLIKTAIAHATLQVPMEFTISQGWFSWDCNITTPDFKLGYVQRKIFSLTTQYDFYDTNDVLNARGVKRWFSWGTTFDVSDAQDNPIGRVEERIFNFFPTFEIISSANNSLAIAKLNFFGTAYTIYDPISQNEFATMERSIFTLISNWTVKITNPELFETKQIDPRLFILLAVFQTDRDIHKAVESMQNQGPS